MNKIVVELTAEELAWTTIGLDRFANLEGNNPTYHCQDEILHCKEKWDSIYRCFHDLKKNGVKETK